VSVFWRIRKSETSAYLFEVVPLVWDNDRREWREEQARLMASSIDSARALKPAWAIPVHQTALPKDPEWEEVWQCRRRS
jgi:hypothetical protein